MSAPRSSKPWAATQTPRDCPGFCALAEPALRAEPDEHLDEELPEGANPLPNRRNGSNPKTLTTDSGKVLLDRPRDRNGSFDPIPIAKYRRRFPEVDTRIVSLYARGMTTREIPGQIEAPVDPDALAADTPEGRQMQVYSMSLMSIRVDTEAEAQYLDSLAKTLGLNQQQVNELHMQMGVKPLYS